MMQDKTLWGTVIASSLSAGAAQVIRYGFGEYLGKWTALSSAALTLLLFASVALLVFPRQKSSPEGRKEQVLSRKLCICSALVLTGALLPAVPLYRFSLLLGERLGYTAFDPVVFPRDGFGQLLLYCVLPCLLLSVALLGIGVPLLKRVLPELPIVRYGIVGLLTAVVVAEPLRAPVYFLLGGVLAYLCEKAGKILSVIYAVFVELLFRLTMAWQLEKDGSAWRNCGMLLLFSGFTLLLWIYGSRGLQAKRTEKTNGILLLLPWILALLLAVSGCAIIAYTATGT